MNKLLNEYQRWAETVQNVLRADTSWILQYKEYAESILGNDSHKKYSDARKKFHLSHPLHAYLTIGKIKEPSQKISFDLRYLGQSVGTIEVMNEDVMLSVSEKQAASNKKYFGCLGEAFDYKAWDRSPEAKQFRAQFKNAKKLAGAESSVNPYSVEHMVESALFSEFEKRRSATKTLKRIQPVSFAGARIHMKTAVTANRAGINDTISLSKTGGEIDCLCRRTIQPGVSRFVAIEIKDENKPSESFNAAMKQAICYAVFLRELLRSEAGEGWKTILGMGKQYTETIAIDAVVAMPQGVTKPGYCGERIELGNGDFIELHYIEVTSSINSANSEDVQFTSSYVVELST